MAADGEDRTCRFCFSATWGPSQPMVKPCRCTSWVHTACLDRWRAASPNPESFYRCDVCHFRYRLQEKPEKRNAARAKYVALVALDFVALLTVLMIAIAGLGFILLWVFPDLPDLMDSTPWSKYLHLVNHSWNSTLIRVLNVLEFGGLFLLFIMGVVGSILACYRRCCRDEDRGGSSSGPVLTGSSYPHGGACGDCYYPMFAWPHHHHHHAAQHHVELEPCACSAGDRTVDCCCGDCTDLLLCNGGSSGGCTDCGSCSSGDCSGDMGEGAVVLLVLLLVVIAIFILLGVFFGVLAASALVSKILQRHIGVLYRAQRASVWIVQDMSQVDLTAEPDWVGGDTPAPSAPTAPAGMADDDDFDDDGSGAGAAFRFDDFGRPTKKELNAPLLG